MATHSSILTWATPWTEDPGRLQSLGVARVRHDRVTKHPQSTIWVWSSLQNQLSVCRGTEERRHQTGPWACTWQRQLGDASNSQVLLINTCKEIQRMDEEPKIKTDLRDWSTFQMGQNILSRDAHSGNKTIKKKKRYRKWFLKSQESRYCGGREWAGMCARGFQAWEPSALSFLSGVCLMIIY